MSLTECNNICNTTELVVDKKEIKTLSPKEIIQLKAVGIDLGIKTLAVLSDGTIIENPKWYRNAQKRLRKMQKKLSRMKRGSKNYEKQRLKIATLHEYVANCRKDLMHKVTTEIIDKNQIICLEDLNARGMVKNRKLANVDETGSFSMRIHCDSVFWNPLILISGSSKKILRGDIINW
jgi:putative transposase